MSEPLVCPRRTEVGVVPGGPFKVPEADEWRDDDTCSWCGSLSPAKFFELVEQGATVVPTDKSYKAYVRGPMVHVHGAGKVYFQHFSEDDRRRFVDLLNAKKMTIGEPGRFYVLPFFCVRGPKESV